LESCIFNFQGTAVKGRLKPAALWQSTLIL
jgi:hypothetical protein